ncbi:hypothetical protein [Halalkalicoccus salilacus]|uniref:hypothetical protein n=1 Tax=Halalkalicoccus salilacus TaxID=3117459 RepID=UPI00300E9362
MGILSTGGAPIELTEDRIDRLYYETEHPSRLEIRPYVDTKGMERGEDFLEDIHDTLGTGRKGGTFSFEWWFRDQLTVQILADNDEDLSDIHSLVNSKYANSRMETYQDPLPDAKVGEWASICRINSQLDAIHPISYRGSKGDPLEGDPYSSTLPKFVNEKGVRLIVQGCGKPISSKWYKRGKLGAGGDAIADSTKQGSLEIGLRQADTKVVQSDLNEQLAKDMQDQVSDETFRTTIRLMAIGPDKDDVQSVLTKAAESYSKYDYANKQKLRPQYLKHTAIVNEAEDLVRRRVRKRSPIARLLHGTKNAMTIREWEGLFHIPNDDIEVPDVNWATRESGPGVPRESHTFGADLDLDSDDANQQEAGS